MCERVYTAALVPSPPVSNSHPHFGFGFSNAE